VSRPSSTRPDSGGSPRRSLARALLAGTAAVGLTACAAPDPLDGEPGPPPIPERFVSAPDDGAVTADSVAPDAWWREYGDPELDAAVALALEANPERRAAEALAAAARARARVAAGGLWPQVDARLRASRSRRNFIGLPIPGFPEVLPVTATQDDLGVAVAWEVDLLDRLGARARAAAEAAAAADADADAVAAELAARTVRTWLVLRGAERALTLLEERRDLAAEALAAAHDRFASGRAVAAEVAAREAELAGVAAELGAARRRVAEAHHALAALQGATPTAADSADGARELPEAPPPLAPGLPATVLARRPDLRAAEARLAAAVSTADEAWAARWPRLALTADYGTSTTALGDLLDGDFVVWGLAADLTAPLFHGGALAANAEAAAAEARAAQARFVAAVLRALAEVETALAAEAALREAAAEEDRRVAALADLEAAVADRVDRGQADGLDLLDARARRLGAEAARLEARLALLLARVDLRLALGDGLPEPR